MIYFQLSYQVRNKLFVVARGRVQANRFLNQSYTFSARRLAMSESANVSELPFIAHLLARSCGAARRAAYELRKIVRGRKLDIVEKGPKDLQTAADRNSQQSIVATLKHYFPELRVVGEEGDLPEPNAEERAALVSHEIEEGVLERARAHLKKLSDLPFANAPIDEYTVWVDPLDATNEFTTGALAQPEDLDTRKLLEHVTILIGIAHKDEPVAGVIYQPFHASLCLDEADTDGENGGRLIWALRHCGTSGIDEQLNRNIAERPNLDEQVVMVNTRSHDSAVVREMINVMKPDEVLRVGGCGYKLLLICERRANSYVYPSLGTKKWDTCAPQCLLDELDGHFTDLFGNRLRYGSDAEAMNSQGLFVCTSTNLYERLNSILPEATREAMRNAAQNPTKRH